MTIRKLLAFFLLALALEVGLFALAYDDLLFLRRPPDELTTEPLVFARQAGEALARSKVTRQHLETIARTARRLGMADVEARALERLTAIAPAEAGVRLRLADALRRTGQYAAAERIYLDMLDAEKRDER